MGVAARAATATSSAADAAANPAAAATTTATTAAAAAHRGRLPWGANPTRRGAPTHPPRHLGLDDRRRRLDGVFIRVGGGRETADEHWHGPTRRGGALEQQPRLQQLPRGGPCGEPQQHRRAGGRQRRGGGGRGRHRPPAPPLSRGTGPGYGGPVGRPHRRVGGGERPRVRLGEGRIGGGGHRERRVGRQALDQAQLLERGKQLQDDGPEGAQPVGRGGGRGGKCHRRHGCTLAGKGGEGGQGGQGGSVAGAGALYRESGRQGEKKRTRKTPADEPRGWPGEASGRRGGSKGGGATSVDWGATRSDELRRRPYSHRALSTPPPPPSPCSPQCT
ncbi:hypothetical protein I4F81_006627 [Pyropia yezoensis]|uniref:Uncharacterized protein n=1 Tax=Pyropia yezoensis TaxID=2788 RepID=A0ACC3C1N9_PYRYE|nr:hypothetical protein I4F81_006627 [Neopyropia yezoensis]